MSENILYRPKEDSVGVCHSSAPETLLSAISQWTIPSDVANLLHADPLVVYEESVGDLPSTDNPVEERPRDWHVDGSYLEGKEVVTWLRLSHRLDSVAARGLDTAVLTRAKAHQIVTAKAEEHSVLELIAQERACLRSNEEDDCKTLNEAENLFKNTEPHNAWQLVQMLQEIEYFFQNSQLWEWVQECRFQFLVDATRVRWIRSGILALFRDAHVIHAGVEGDPPRAFGKTYLDTGSILVPHLGAKVSE